MHPVAFEALSKEQQEAINAMKNRIKWHVIADEFIVGEMRNVYQQFPELEFGWKYDLTVFLREDIWR